MKRLLSTYVYVALLGTALNAQNLVPNGDFESYNDCSNGLSWSDLDDWSFPIWATNGIYFNECDGLSGSGFYSVPDNLHGYQFARSGQGYVGIQTYTFTPIANYLWNSRRYITTELDPVISVGQTHCVSIAVNLPNNSYYHTNQLFVHFSWDFPDAGGVVQLDSGWWHSPNTIMFDSLSLDTMNWTVLTDTIHALENLRYATVGYFRFGDDIDSLSTGYNSGSPLSGELFIDDVYVGDCAFVGIEEHIAPQISIFPNPSNGRFTISGLDQEAVREVRVLNSQGQLLATKTFAPKINLNGFAAGVYWLQFVLDSGVFSERLMLVE